MSVNRKRPRNAGLSPLADLKALEIFASVIETQSLTKAARRLGVGVPAISKKLSELEARAGARLLYRTNRRLSVTEIGRKLHERCLKISEEIEKAETELWDENHTPSGKLHIAMPVGLGRIQLVPLLAQFIRKYPDIQVEVDMSPRTVNLIEDGIDVAIRLVNPDKIGSGMIQLCANKRVFCASPMYLQRHGEPAGPEDLTRHSCLIAKHNELFASWPYMRNNRLRHVRVSGPFVADNVEALRQIAVDGIGIAYLGLSLVASDLASGALKTILHRYAVQDSMIVAVLPHNDFVPRRTATLIGFLREQLGPVPPWEREPPMANAVAAG